VVEEIRTEGEKTVKKVQKLVGVVAVVVLAVAVSVANMGCSTGGIGGNPTNVGFVPKDGVMFTPSSPLVPAIMIHMDIPTGGLGDHIGGVGFPDGEVPGYLLLGVTSSVPPVATGTVSRAVSIIR